MRRTYTEPGHSPGQGAALAAKTEPSDDGTVARVRRPTAPNLGRDGLLEDGEDEETHAAGSTW